MIQLKTPTIAGLFTALCALCCLTSCDRGAPVKGDKLQSYFPASTSDYKVVVTTEREGFAQASLKVEGNEVGTLAISDLSSDLEAQKKFEGAGKDVAGYPAIARGSAGTAVLVGQFQIQVRSMSEALTVDDREVILGKFALDKIAKLK